MEWIDSLSVLLFNLVKIGIWIVLLLIIARIISHSVRVLRRRRATTESAAQQQQKSRRRVALVSQLFGSGVDPTANIGFVSEQEAWRYNPRTQFRRVSPIGTLDREECETDDESAGGFRIGLEMSKPEEEQPTNRSEKEESIEVEALPHTWAVISYDYKARADRDYGFSNLVDEVVLNHKQSKLNGVVVIINSPGGYVFEYGLLYAQMERLRALEIPLISCIDSLGASGGYLMALPSTKIVASPFAILGSVGVVASMLNFHELLKNLGIDPRLYTAGKFKRTITQTQPIEPEHEEHFKEKLEQTHDEFLACLKKYRPDCKVEEIQSGDSWSATESVARELGLVDRIATSNDVLLEINQTEELLYIFRRQAKKPEWLQDIAAHAAESFARVVLETLQGRAQLR